MGVGVDLEVTQLVTARRRQTVIVRTVDFFICGNGSLDSWVCQYLTLGRAECSYDAREAGGVGETRIIFPLKS